MLLIILEFTLEKDLIKRLFFHRHEHLKITIKLIEGKNKNIIINKNRFIKFKFI